MPHKIINRLSLVALIFIFFVGCSVKVDLPQEPTLVLPAWYVSPPNNDAIYLYGLGEGKNMQEAQTSALEHMASRIEVKISSQIDLKESSFTDFREYIKRESSQNIKSEVSQTVISNFELLHSHQASYNRFIVLLRSKTDEMITKLRQEVDETFESVKKEQRGLVISNSLTQMLFYKRAVAYLESKMPKIAVLKSLDARFDQSGYMRFLQMMRDELRATKSELTFVIKAEDKNARFADIIKIALINEGFRFSQKGDDKSITIHLHSNEVVSAPYGIHMVAMTLVVDFIDTHENSVASHTFHLKGSSSASRESALLNAQKEFEKEVNVGAKTTKNSLFW